MKYTPYSQMIESPLVGQLPEGWERRRLKFCISYNDESLPENTEPDTEISYVDISSVNLVEGITFVDELTFEKAPSRARRIVRNGDTIVSTVRTYLKAIAAINDPPQNMIVSTGFAVIRPTDIVDSRYLSYFLQSQNFVDTVVANSVGVSYPAINASDLVCIPIAYPKKTEAQKKIADFLDHKTAQIDRLIEKKKALIEKLNEKRIALITQAVTKGLNPDVPMKSSGIDWLGDVPTHWDVLKLKHITRRIIDGAHFTPTYVTEGMPFLRVTDIVKSDGKLIDLNNIKFIPLEEHEELIKRCMPEKGDLLYSKNGTIGISRVIDWNWEFSIFVSLCLIKLEQEKMLPNFLSAYLESKVTQNQIAIGAKSNTVTNLHLDKIKEFIICLPPLDEQIDILESIEDELKKVDDMRHINNQTIERLTEYRTALITAAVTGKIDVRGIDIPSQEAA